MDLLPCAKNTNRPKITKTAKVFMSVMSVAQNRNLPADNSNDKVR